MGQIKVYDTEVMPGTKTIVTIPVTKDLGVDIRMKAHVLAGRHEGPTMLILSMLHGEEWFSALIIRELISKLNLEELRGNIIAVPVANTSAFNTGTRCLMDNSDEPDANRAFGGNYQWLSNQITRIIENELFTISDFLIDYHIGSWGSTMADIGYGSDYEDTELTETSKGMALSYGFPMIHAMTLFKGTHSDRTSMGCAGVRHKIPGIVPEIGGLGFGEEIEKGWLDQNINGIMGNLRYLNMLDGEPDLCPEYLFIGDYWRTSPKNAGYIDLKIGLDRQFTKINKNEHLADVIDPETFEVLEEIRSPGEGVLFYTCRSFMSRPGGWTFGIANMEESASKWIKKENLDIKPYEQREPKV
jgi:uncharacterized protein